MKRVHIVILLAGMFLALAYPSHAQLPNSSSSSTSEQAEASKYEQYYEIVL